MKNLILIRVCIMSKFFVILVLKTVIYVSKFLGFQNYKSLELEHYKSDSRFYWYRLICIRMKIPIFSPLFVSSQTKCANHLLEKRLQIVCEDTNVGSEIFEKHKSLELEHYKSDSRFYGLRLICVRKKIGIFLFLTYCTIALFLSSCSFVFFNSKNNLHKEPLPVKKINSYFTNSDSTYLYQTEIRFMKNYYSGLMVIKSQSDSVKRLVFITEMGIKIFDIEIKNSLINKNYYTVNFIIEPMSRKMIVKTLVNDLGMLCQNGNVKFIDAYANDGNTFLRIKNRCKSYYYIYGMNEKNYNEIIVNSTFKQKSDINFYGINNFAPDSIKLKHFGLNLNYVFRRIKQ